MIRRGAATRAALLASMAALSTGVAIACARPTFSLRRMPPTTWNDPAKPPLDGFVARGFREHRDTFPYRLFIPPDYSSHRKYPVVVWLHGAGGLGSDNFLNITNDQVPGTRLWTTPENQANHPAFVLVPQTPSGWAFGDSGRRAVDIVPPMLSALATEYAIDTTRLYVAGQSLGGAGAWELMRTHPNLFAAGIVVCPALSEFRAGVTTPVWIFVGDQDSPSIVEGSRRMRDSINAAGRPLRYTEYPGAGHDIWERVFQEPDLVPWLFSKHR
jgi:predicted peptidase